MLSIATIIVEPISIGKCSTQITAQIKTVYEVRPARYAVIPAKSGQNLMKTTENSCIVKLVPQNL